MATEASYFLHWIPAGVEPGAVVSERSAVVKGSLTHSRAELPSGMIVTGLVALCLNQSGSASSISATSEVTPSGFGNRPLSGDSNICQRAAAIGMSRLTIWRRPATLSETGRALLLALRNQIRPMKQTITTVALTVAPMSTNFRTRRSLLWTLGVCRVDMVLLSKIFALSREHVRQER